MTPHQPATTRAPRLQRALFLSIGLASLLIVSGCAGAAAPVDSPNVSNEQANTAAQPVNTACPDLVEKYHAALDTTSTGQDHPNNYTVQDSTTEQLASQLPPGVLDSVHIDCVVSAYSSAVESTQIVGFVLSPTAEQVAAVRSAITAAGWQQHSTNEGAYRAPDPGTTGAQTWEIDTDTAAQVGVPGAAFVIIAGTWTLWGAF